MKKFPDDPIVKLNIREYISKYDPIEELQKIVHEITMGHNQPSEFLDGWNLPKNTPNQVKLEIINRCEKATEQRKKWVYRITEAIWVLTGKNK